MFSMLAFIWRMKPRPAGGQEEGCMFWSAHFMHVAPNSELGAQITRNPFRLTASISLDFSIDWWVRTYCTGPPINGARSRRQPPPPPETGRGPPQTDRGPLQTDRDTLQIDMGPP